MYIQLMEYLMILSTNCCIISHRATSLNCGNLALVSYKLKDHYVLCRVNPTRSCNEIAT